ncbi:MAG: hypothetical protein IJN03_00360 [Bacilli bacterium]|nr:hypothetical protein [Bacilli bacterium]
MDINLQMELKKNEKMYNFLKENSYWIKELNRNPESYKKFVQEMKIKYKLRPTDKVNEVIDNIDLISTVLQTLK